MSDDLFGLEDEEEVGDDLAVDDGFLPEAATLPAVEVAAPVQVDVNTDGIGKTIADALSGATAAQTAAFRSLAQEFISSQPKAAAPAKTREQIAARNTQLQALLMDTTGDVDIEEQIRSIIRPVVEEGIQGTLRTVRPEADNLSAGQGERALKEFKREVKELVNEKHYSKYVAEIDSLIPRSQYAALAQATPERREAYLKEVLERVDGRVYRGALSDKSPRGQQTGSGGGGSKSALQQAYSALDKDMQREGRNYAKAFARNSGHKEGTPEYVKVYNAKLQDYVEG